MEIRHEKRLVNHIHLHCVIAGDGPLLILLHGFPEFWYSWRHQISVFAEHFTVVAPDMRGYNKSDKPQHVSDYALPTLVEDIVQLIHSFDQEQAIIVGHDWGGVVAWEIALTHADVVKQLAILNVPHPRVFVQHLLTNPRQILRSWYIGFFQLPIIPELAIRSNDYASIEQALRGTAVHKEQFPDEVIATFKQAAAQPGALTSAINYYRANAQRGLFTLSGNDPVVTAHTLVIWGEQDVALGKELNNDLRRYVPNLTLRFIPDASHWVQQDRPDLVNQYLYEFLLG